MVDDPGGRRAYIALALVPGIGSARMRALLAEFGSADGALAAPFARLGTVRGMSRAAASAVAGASLAAADRALEAAGRLGAVVLVQGDARYPAALVSIPEPPTLLFALGHLSLLERPAVAVVGSRDPTAYGVDVCRRIVGQAAAAGIVVVSGMARGLDAVAHEQALGIGGGTIGVLGNGLGVVYPAANRRLYERVAAGGLLLTEFPPGERPSAGSFPRRNRLISGLATATVVVEAAERSGALITASAAADQGREVLAVPGPITSPTAAGVNRLLRDGATPYLEPLDLLQHYPGSIPVAGRPREAGGSGSAGRLAERIAAAGGTAGSGLTRVAAFLGADGTRADAIAERTRLPVAEVLAHLSALEICGVAEQLPGGHFRRAGEP